MAGIKKVALGVLECAKCHYEWYQRMERKPKVCPKCKSYFWEKIPKVLKSK